MNNPTKSYNKIVTIPCIRQEVFPLKKQRGFFTGLDYRNVLSTPHTNKMFLMDLSGLKVEAKAALTGESIHQLDSPHWPIIYLAKIQGGMLPTTFN